MFRISTSFSLLSGLSDAETPLHLFRGCVVIRALWQPMENLLGLRLGDQDSLSSFLTSCCNKPRDAKGSARP
jgi:hypothetical protein